MARAGPPHLSLTALTVTLPSPDAHWVQTLQRHLFSLPLLIPTPTHLGIPHSKEPPPHYPPHNLPRASLPIKCTCAPALTHVIFPAGLCFWLSRAPGYLPGPS